jgi:hypothetical protein
MSRLHCSFVIVACACSALVLSTGQLSAQAPGAPSALLAVSNGQIPNDTGLDGETKMTIAKSAELGGNALKVVFAAGDSFGDRSAKVKNWKPFSHIRFNVFNPTQEDVHLDFNVNHKGTSAFETRVVHGIDLSAGKNEVSIAIAELANTDGSAPDLANVVKWFINCEEEKTPTLFFSDIVLGGADTVVPTASSAAPARTAAPAAEAAAAPIGVPGLGSVPSGGLRVQGTIGDAKVDLIVTPIGNGATINAAPASGATSARRATPASPQSSESALVTGDPARLKRLRATKMPKVTKVIDFNTPEADAVVSALEVFPPNNPWNLVVSDWPLHPLSRELVESIGTDKPLRANSDMCYIIVPPNQPLINVTIDEAPDESDPGPFPIPQNLPIEGWPKWQAKDGSRPTLAAIQNRPAAYEDDRHAIIIDPTAGKLYEFFVMGRTADGWSASSAATFDLKSNKLRPDTWTSADAAGLPIFPAVVRYDELQRGEIEHALRFTIRRSRKEYVYPATHQAGHGDEENLPRMGERFRLRQDFNTAGFSPNVRTILKALKKYGMFVADNGIEWALSVAPDPRIPEIHAELRKVKGADFEVVQFPPGYEPPTE